MRRTSISASHRWWLVLGASFCLPALARAAGEVSPVEAWIADFGLAPALALVALMGLALNLTPCVYPLISVTLAWFGRQSCEGTRRTPLLAVVYVLGIAITFSVLGVAAALSGGLFGAALQRPLVVVTIASVMVLLALSSFGLYSLRPPAWFLQRVGGGGRGILGSLFMGLTMGVVAAPCVGPIVVGLLIAVGSRGDPLFGFLLFFTLSLGLGAPYVVLGVLAGSITRLPRSGEWLVWIEHVFGFLLLGLALYFVSPLLPKPILGWVMPLFVASAALWLGFLDASGRGWRAFRLARGALGTAVLVAAVWVAWPSTGDVQALEWAPYSPETLKVAAESRRPAVVDFRADWCLPCIEMEKTTFVAPEVIARADGIAFLRADVTAMSEDQEDWLGRHEVLGVPTTLFFDAAGREVHRMVGYVAPADFAALLQGLSVSARATLRDRVGSVGG